MGNDVIKKYVGDTIMMNTQISRIQRCNNFYEWMQTCYSEDHVKEQITPQMTREITLLWDLITDEALAVNPQPLITPGKTPYNLLTDSTYNNIRLSTAYGQKKKRSNTHPGADSIDGLIAGVEECIKNKLTKLGPYPPAVVKPSPVQTHLKAKPKLAKQTTPTIGREEVNNSSRHGRLDEIVVKPQVVETSSPQLSLPTQKTHTSRGNLNSEKILYNDESIALKLGEDSAFILNYNCKMLVKKSFWSSGVTTKQDVLNMKVKTNNTEMSLRKQLWTTMLGDEGKPACRDAFFLLLKSLAQVDPRNKSKNKGRTDLDSAISIIMREGGEAEKNSLRDVLTLATHTGYEHRNALGFTAEIQVLLEDQLFLRNKGKFDPKRDSCGISNATVGIARRAGEKPQDVVALDTALRNKT